MSRYRKQPWRGDHASYVCNRLPNVYKTRAGHFKDAYYELTFEEVEAVAGMAARDGQTFMGQLARLAAEALAQRGPQDAS